MSYKAGAGQPNDSFKQKQRDAAGIEGDSKEVSKAFQRILKGFGEIGWLRSPCSFPFFVGCKQAKEV
jgi:hypothetical protein